MQSAIKLEDLLVFMQPDDARADLVGLLSKTVPEADFLIGIESKILKNPDNTLTYERGLSKVSAGAYDFYMQREETRGPQESSHLGWLFLEFGNYYSRLAQTGQQQQLQTSAAAALNDRALMCYYEAWDAFVNSRGHEDTAFELKEEAAPRLNEFAFIQKFYQEHPKGR